jgi:hypothetical protein
VMAEKNRTLIVVYTVNEIPFSMEESHNLWTNDPEGP